MKQYNGEKAIISLTSWKARINTVGLTLFSLVKRCPGFHIVLVLSEEEFPKKEAELPDTVMAFVEQDLIEILWVYKNYKSFKKVLFTMDKYKDVPVISADDDYIYRYNYANELYQQWQKMPHSLICMKKGEDPYGFATLHPPKIYNLATAIPVFDECLNHHCSHDDGYYAEIARLNNIPIISRHKQIKDVCIITNNNKSLTHERKILNINNRAIIHNALLKVISNIS